MSRALLFRQFRKTGFAIYQRTLSSSSLSKRLQDVQENFVIISHSTDIFRNLALEEWLYTNCNFRDGARGLLLWRNQPCIVIGRHQNPWVECAVKSCRENGVHIVRRNSGGGTVYHDMGNLNLCFLTNKTGYNRKNNLSFLSSVLKNNWDIDCEISSREDLVLRNGGFKVSGTASKLSSKTAYHHCTLLVNVDLSSLRKAIRSVKNPRLESKATESVKSPVKNLAEVYGNLDMESLVTGIAAEYSKLNDAKDVFELEPSDSEFCGVNSSEDKLKTWDWVYGKTPRFSISNRIKAGSEEYVYTITVFRGIIENFSMEPCVNRAIPDLIGCRFKESDVSARLRAWCHQHSHSDWTLFTSAAINNELKVIEE